MSSSERIELTRAELRGLLFAAVLVPPLCTLAGVLTVLATMPAAEISESVPASIARVEDVVPTIEFAEPAVTEQVVVAHEAAPPAAAEPLAVAHEIAPLVQSRARRAPTEDSGVGRDDPVGAGLAREIASARTALPATAPTALPMQIETGPFIVQAGVFTRQANARQCRDALRRRGVSSTVVAHAGARGTAWHVVLGRYESWSGAEQARTQLAAELRLELFAKRLEVQSPRAQVASL